MCQNKDNKIEIFNFEYCEKNVFIYYASNVIIYKIRTWTFWVMGL